jgi:hypothetical protein
MEDVTLRALKAQIEALTADEDLDKQVLLRIDRWAFNNWQGELVITKDGVWLS